MSSPVTIGPSPWTLEEIIESLGEFQEVYRRRPIATNEGGMRAPHMFATWFMVRKLEPDLIVESGVWKGAGTWLLHEAWPQADVYCIDPNLDTLEWRSTRANYSRTDFSLHDWPNVTRNSLAFFDDHQNAYLRAQQCKWAGFRHAIFEDNYPAQRGDCYSLKKALSGTGFGHGATGGWLDAPKLSVRGRLRQYLANRGIEDDREVPPNMEHASLLGRNTEIYWEFPPVFKPETTRWGDSWDDRYPTAEPLLKSSQEAQFAEFLLEAEHYTWICYLRLRD